MEWLSVTWNVQLSRLEAKGNTFLLESRIRMVPVLED